MLHMFIGCPAEAAKPGSTGTVVPGYKARVVDERGEDLPAGTIGRLAVSGPTGCRYLNSIANQQKYVQDGWNLTGDAYWQDADGYFWYVSRTDDMIVTSGYNVSGPEVENVLLTHAAVAECAVVGIPDDARGQIVKAFVVPATGQATSDTLARELQDFVKRELAPYKYPRAIEFVDELPRTLTGKLQRYRLRTANPEPGTLNPEPLNPEPLNLEPRTVNPEPLNPEPPIAFHNPREWAQPKGYANATSATGRIVFVAGQVGWDPVTLQFTAGDFVAEVRQALANVVAALEAAGARPDQLTRLTWYITDRDEYLRNRAEIGRIYREIIGRHFPAMSVVVVQALIEPDARVEIEATAIVPDEPASSSPTR
jgi:enamine deaminase RidA (YjgF/YER057c/UK114 family)